MDAESTSPDALMDPVNETVAEIGRWNLNLPSYLYKEIPTVFEVIGVILNAIIIIYFTKSKKYASPLFAILTSLATMDLCVCLGGMMNIFAYPTVITPEMSFLCWLIALLTSLGVIGSEYHLIFFAALRFYQVMSPLKARASVTVGLVVKWCSLIAVLSVINAVCSAIFYRSSSTIIDGEEMTVCIFIGDNYLKDKSYYYIMTVIPCVSIFLIHVMKYFAYMRSRDFVGTQQERKSPDARVAAILITLFYISFVPFLVNAVIQWSRIKDYVSRRDNLNVIFVHLVYANSIMNPLVYVLTVKSIRDDAIKLFCFGRCTSSR